MRKFLHILAATSALLGASGAALATDVFTFDALDPGYSDFAPFAPLLGSGDTVFEGDYGVGLDAGKAGAGGTDLVGAIIDGADLSTCAGVVCPSNNATSFLGALNDGIPYLFRLDGGIFNFKSFDAGFIAPLGDAVPDTALLLRVQGYFGSGRVFQQDILLAGPTGGLYSFSNYALSATFADTAVTEIDFIGYACNTAGSCTRALDKAQYALDNLTMTPPVPEPATWALFGLGLVGVVLARRRGTTPA